MKDHVHKESHSHVQNRSSPLKSPRCTSAPSHFFWRLVRWLWRWWWQGLGTCLRMLKHVNLLYIDTAIFGIVPIIATLYGMVWTFEHLRSTTFLLLLLAFVFALLLFHVIYIHGHWTTIISRIRHTLFTLVFVFVATLKVFLAQSHHV